MAVTPVPPLPLLASHAAVRAAVSRVAASRPIRVAGDEHSNHPPQVAALRRGDWVKLICGASFEVPHIASPSQNAYYFLPCTLPPRLLRPVRVLTSLVSWVNQFIMLERKEMLMLMD